MPVQTFTEKRLSIEDTRIALAETNPGLRSAFMNTFTRMGFQDIQLCKDAPGLLNCLEGGIVDLVVAANDLEGLYYEEMVQIIRQASVGRNPFTLIMATVSDATVSDIRRISNAGVDRVVVKPLSLGTITKQIETMCRRRRPFIATRAYVGPCRRAAGRDKSGDMIAIDVPNTLRSKGQGGFTPKLLDSLIADGMKQLSGQRALNGCRTLLRSLEVVSGKLEKVDEVQADEITKIVDVCLEVEDCFSGTPKEPLAELAVALRILCERMTQPGSHENAETARLLMIQVAEVFRRAERVGPESQATVRHIARSVRYFAESAEIEAFL